MPLLVLTADRPHELRDAGAPQTIDQIRLYGAHAKWFVEMALPEQTPSALRYARVMAGRAVAEAAIPGPVTRRLIAAYGELVGMDFVGQYLRRLDG